MRIATVLAVALLGTTSLAAVEHAQASIRHYQLNIPRQSLDTALKDLAQQTGLQIGRFSGRIDGSAMVGPVKGEQTPEQALKTLLNNTGLDYKIVSDTTIAVYNPKDATLSATGTRGTDSPLQVPAEGQGLKEQKGEDSAKAGEDKEATQGKSFWDRFRVARVDQGETASVGTVVKSAAQPAAAYPSVEEIVVTGRYEFLSVDTSGATNLPLPIEKVPQSISLVSQDFIKAADLKTLGEIAEYTPGALNVGNEGGFQSYIKLRGFAADWAVDGVSLGSGGLFNYEPDWAIVDRLEVVKGPSSVVYGVANAGGLVNLITKSATASTPSYVSVEGGSWNSYRVEGQLAGAISSNVNGIAVVVRDAGNSFMNDVSHSTWVAYGGVNGDLSSSITAYLHGGYEWHARTSFDGIPTYADGTAAALPRSFFIGSPSDELYTSVYHGEGGVTWHATDMLDVSLKGIAVDSNTHGVETYSYGLESDGSASVGADHYSKYESTGYGINASAVYRLDSLGIQDSFISLLTSYQDYQRELHYGTYTYNGKGAGTINVFDGEQSIYDVFDTAVPRAAQTTQLVNSRILTVSGQSVVKLLEHLSALLGASAARLNQDKDVIRNGTGAITGYRFPSHMSYRGGLTYEFLPGANSYVSYSQSFEPQADIDLSGNIVPPLEGEQYEVGVKYRSPKGRLLLTGAAFQIAQKNAVAFAASVDGQDRFEPLGEVKHKGVELQALGQATQQWQVNAGYTYLNPKITRDSDPTVVGQTETFLPKQTADVFTEYHFDAAPVKGLSVGGGIRYVGAERTAIDGSTRDLAGYTVVDLTAGYVIDDWSLRLNIHNLFDRRYFINNYQTLFYGNTVGQPTNFALTLRRNF